MKQHDLPYLYRLVVAAKTNNILISRVPKRNKIFALILIVFASIIISILSFSFSIMIIKDTNDLNLRIYIGSLLCFFFMFEIAYLAGRHSIGSAIQLYSLSILPLSPIFLFSHLLVGSLFNFISVLYCLFLMITSITFFYENIYYGIISFIILLSYFIFMKIVMVLIYLYFGKSLKRNNIISPLIIIIFYIPIFSFQLKILSEEQLILFFNLPVIGWVGEGLLAAVNDQWSRVIFVILMVVICSLVGIFLGKFKIEHSFDLLY